MRDSMCRGWILPFAAALPSLLTGCAIFAAEPEPVSLKDRWLTVTSVAPTERPSSASTRAQPRLAVQRPTARPAPDRSACSDASLCVAQLRAIVENPDRTWIGRPEPPSMFANGVRLFAYRALRAKLTCGELALAIKDIESSAGRLETSIHGRSAEQIVRVKALAGEVHEELRGEHDGRCRNIITGEAGHAMAHPLR